MRTIRTAHAIARLAITDTRLATHHAYVRLTGNVKETPRFRRYNNAVAAALLDPHLPARFREPADLAH
jgi:hypothetical protein